MPDNKSAEEYIIKQGDCITSIAAERGFFWQAIWDHNSRLRSIRPNPNALLEGDILLIPEKQMKEESGQTEKRHRFVKKGTPAKFRLIVERHNKPIANKRYLLIVDGRSIDGTTDANGMLEVALNPMAQRGTLSILEEELKYELEFGYMDPLTENVGAQARLQNLGFYDGELDGEFDQETKEALELFQAAVGLTVNGELDDATRDRLLRRHDQEHDQLPDEEAQDEPPAASEETGGGEPEQADDVEINEEEDELEFARLENSDSDD